MPCLGPCHTVLSSVHVPDISHFSTFHISTLQLIFYNYCVCLNRSSSPHFDLDVQRLKERELEIQRERDKLRGKEDGKLPGNENSGTEKQKADLTDRRVRRLVKKIGAGIGEQPLVIIAAGTYNTTCCTYCGACCKSHCLILIDAAHFGPILLTPHLLFAVVSGTLSFSPLIFLLRNV